MGIWIYDHIDNSGNVLDDVVVAQGGTVEEAYKDASPLLATIGGRLKYNQRVIDDDLFAKLEQLLGAQRVVNVPRASL